MCIKEADKKKIRPIAEKATNLGFDIVATAGTGDATGLKSVQKVKKVSQGSPNIRDAILNKGGLLEHARLHLQLPNLINMH